MLLHLPITNGGSEATRKWGAVITKEQEADLMDTIYRVAPLH